MTLTLPMLDPPLWYTISSVRVLGTCSSGSSSPLPSRILIQSLPACFRSGWPSGSLALAISNRRGWVSSFLNCCLMVFERSTNRPCDNNAENGGVSSSRVFRFCAIHSSETAGMKEWVLKK